MRHDSIGLFWQDVETSRKRGEVARVMPEIPETDWQPLRDLPNLERASYISVDVETCDKSLQKNLGPGWARGDGYIAGISIGADDDGRWYFPIRHTIEPETNYNPERIINWAKVELARKEQPKIGANLMYDYGWLCQEGILMQGQLYDVQFAEALLDSDAFVALEAQAVKYLGEHKQADMLVQWLSAFYGGPATMKQRENIWRSPPRLAAPYAIGDIDLPPRILWKQWNLLKQQGLLDLFHMECNLIPLLAAMRFAGVSVDTTRAAKARDYLLEKETTYTAQLRSMTGMDVNVNAGDSLAKAFDKLGVPYPVTDKTKKPSFKKEFLKSVQHPIGNLVRETRKVQKTRTTFIESYILNSNVNGKIYPSIHPLKGDENGTITGRFAMSNPNGQNLSARDEEMGMLVRGCFIPDHGHKQWRKFDWSQLQYRFLAHYAVGSGADELRHIFNTDPKADYHEVVQRLIQQITGTLLDRKPVKNINFGFVFGMGIKHLAELLGLTLEKATELATQYHLGVPYVKETLRAASDEAQESGIVTTVLGRKTRFNLWEPNLRGRRAREALTLALADELDLDEGDRLPGLPYARALEKYGDNLRRAYTHKALNYKLQGSEGDYMKACMLRAWNEGVFAATGVPRLTVHDELDFSDTGESDDAFDYLQHDIMEGTVRFRVPMSVGVDVGPTWGDCL